MKEWEEQIFSHYKTFSDMDSKTAYYTYLDTLSKFPCYGCSYFPVCSELPPSGFFEYRTQNWSLGVNYKGIVIIDNDFNRYVHKFEWETINFGAINFAFVILECAKGKTKEITLYTPQSFIIQNISLRLKYKWARENLKWRPAQKSIPAQPNNISMTKDQGINASVGALDEMDDNDEVYNICNK